MKKGLSSIVAFTLALALCAQEQRVLPNVEFDAASFPDKKAELQAAQKMLEQGTKLYESGKGVRGLESLPYLLKANDFNPNNANLNIMIGDCYLNSPEKSKAIPFYQKAASLASPAMSVAVKKLGGAYHHTYQLDEAIQCFDACKANLNPNDKAYEENLRYFDKKIAECKVAKELVADPVSVVISNLGAVVNSSYMDYSPVINADASSLYFTSTRANDYSSPVEGDYSENIYETNRLKGGQWTPPANLGATINKAGNSAVAGISPDGQMLFVYLDENGGDLGYSMRVGDSWGPKKSLGRAINSPAHESNASLSPDGRTLFFISNRPNSNNPNAPKKHHIYYSRKDATGNWTPARPMGAPIDSEEEEVAVFAHPNGKTLFFSSNGHNTMGGFDIFRSDLKDGRWGTPVNIGYPINTPDNDNFFVLSASGRHAYFSSFRSGGSGWQDIYQITFVEPKQTLTASEDKLIAYMQKPLSEIAVAEKVQVNAMALTLLKGAVKDASTETPIQAIIEIYDNELNVSVASFETNSLTGRYMVSLPSGKNYGIFVRADGYLFYSENIDIRSSVGYQELEKDIKLSKPDVGAKVALRNIFFETGKAMLTDESISELNRVVDLLNGLPKLSIEISGYTDNVGQTAFNQHLSEARAKSVVDYLTLKGISAARLTYVGYGSEFPLADNSTSAGRAQNRRTEFKILKNE
ncbi:MAG: OmpA family protein [Prevotellaceae bacterium]|jgi:outer membrane protein OmpA-like peptidoglycan-associated protein|nr:OmpA family protein [Prevotellaceae bacterium]